jgi:Spy/CpxP family protein refolding chaperone
MALILWVSPAFAGPRGGWGQGMGMGPGYGGAVDADENLNLTQEQSAKVQALREKYLNDITPLQNQMFSLRSEMRLLWIAATPDRDKIMAKHKEIFALEGQLQERAIQYRLDYRGLLTPEQQSKLAASGMGMGHGPGRRHGGKW